MMSLSPYNWLLGLPLISWLTLIGQMDCGCCCVCIAGSPLPPATEAAGRGRREDGGERKKDRRGGREVVDGDKDEHGT